MMLVSMIFLEKVIREKKFFCKKSKSMNFFHLFEKHVVGKRGKITHTLVRYVILHSSI